jgi:hypothetical protein
MGIVGATLVAFWAKNLLVETGKVLLDREMDHPVMEEIRGRKFRGVRSFGCGLPAGHVCQS